MRRILPLLLLPLLLSRSASAAEPADSSYGRGAVGAMATAQAFRVGDEYVTKIVPVIYGSYTIADQTSLSVSYGRQVTGEGEKTGIFSGSAIFSLMGYEPGARVQVAFAASMLHLENAEALYPGEKHYPWVPEVSLRASYGVIQNEEGENKVYLTGQAGLSPDSNTKRFLVGLNVPVLSF